MAGRWDPVNDAIRDALTGITLADMAAATIPRAFRKPEAAKLLNEVN
jgi:DNA-binding IscR family transcriptional regulator